MPLQSFVFTVTYSWILHLREEDYPSERHFINTIASLFCGFTLLLAVGTAWMDILSHMTEPLVLALTVTPNIARMPAVKALPSSVRHLILALVFLATPVVWNCALRCMGMRARVLTKAYIRGYLKTGNFPMPVSYTLGDREEDREAFGLENIRFRLEDRTFEPNSSPDAKSLVESLV
ncbi:hypothetical protein B0H16DRAFT_1519594 [Mycena metata]|uniref:Uncharacterized protein n=1 Tax=Mycena metata TaxID=1033252 RepID=A0AAD7NP62_9AGAR|nr:hypothetical protein B0H16DRAFT_1519594 [Mycena metata]